MENIFPLQENVEVEEIYGSRRPNAAPRKNSKAFRMRSDVSKAANGDMYGVKSIAWFKKGEMSSLELVSMEEVIHDIGENKYKETRDKIINGYEGGERPMTIRGALRLTDIDLCSLLKIFSFVERWGLINYRSLVRRAINDLESYGIENGGNVSDVRLNDTGEVIDLKRKLEGCACDCGGKVAFFTRSSMFKCDDCISNGVYPREILQSDFLPVTESLIGDMWSKKEEFFLLEGINKFGDDWELVSGHVRTKTREQCILHFLRMPILENTLSKANFSMGLVFETAENPIMCVVVFICGMVHPTVASECAKTAMRHVGKCPQDGVIQHVLQAGKARAIEQRNMERKKIERLKNVMCEALLNKIRMKIWSYKELHLSTRRIRDELVTLRRSLVEELSFIDER